MRAALLLLAALPACAEFPALDARLSDSDRGAAPPALVSPTDLLAAADALPRAAPVPSTTRADALAARAAALRGAVLTEEERARLTQARAAPPALR